MKKSILGLTVFAFLIIINYTLAQEPNMDFEPGKLIIKTTQSLNLQTIGNTGISSIDSLNNLYRVSLITQLFNSIGLDPQKLELYNQIGLGRIYVLTLPDTTDILEVVEVYKNLSEIEYAEPNMYLRPLDVYPCDELFQNGFQWSLYNRDSLIFWGCNKLRADIKAPEAWQIEKGDTNIIVGMVDTGIDRGWAEIHNRIWINWVEKNGLPGVDDDNNGYVDDSLGWNFGNNSPVMVPILDYHGTHLSLIIGAESDSTNNCVDVAGINWKCKIMNLRVDGYVCYDDSCYYTILTTSVADAIWYASRNGAKVINLSLAYPFDPKVSLPDSLKTIGNALNFAYGIGVVSVAGMGNGYEPEDWYNYPAASSKTLAVGATNCKDNRVTKLTTYWESSHGLHIDLVAPGEWIWTGYDLHGDPFTEGTSASTAIVSGIASLVITHRKRLIPNEVLTAEQIYEVLRHTADDTVGHTYEYGDTLYPLEDTLCFDEFYGWGRANAFKALVAVSHGDVNNDSKIDMADIIYLINYLLKGGPPPVPVSDMADANCDKKVSLSDIVFLINYVLKGGPPPSLCYTDCSQH